MPIEFEPWKIASLQQMSEGISGALREADYKPLGVSRWGLKWWELEWVASRLKKTGKVFAQMITEPIDLTVPEEEASLHDFLLQAWKQTQEAPTIAECLQTGRTFRKLLAVRRVLESAGINSYEKLTVSPETAIQTAPLATATGKPLSSTREAIIAALQQLKDTDQRANLKQIGQQVGKTRERVRQIYDETYQDLRAYHRQDLLPPSYQIRGRKRQVEFDTQVREFIRQSLTPQQIAERLSVGNGVVAASLRRLKAAGEKIPRSNSIPDTVVA